MLCLCAVLMLNCCASASQKECSAKGFEDAKRQAPQEDVMTYEERQRIEAVCRRLPSRIDVVAH